MLRASPLHTRSSRIRSRGRVDGVQGITSAYENRARWQPSGRRHTAPTWLRRDRDLRARRGWNPKVHDHIGQGPVEVEFGTPADGTRDLLDGRHSVQRVLDAAAVDLVERSERQLRVGAGQLEHAVGEVEDAHLLGRADVEDLA